jgi:hypothetical protein
MEVIPFVNGNYSRYAGLEVNLRLRGDFHGKESFTNPLFSHFPGLELIYPLSWEYRF